MLVGMQVRDFAIIDRVSVDFRAGMTVLTGETGAGKSILVDALGLVLGERGSASLVRDGARRAEFSAEFDIGDLPAVRAWLEDQSLDEEDACLLRRVVNADGRSKAFINGNAVPVQQLKRIGEMLVDIHGQHFHQSLARRSVQRDLLDHFGRLSDKRAAVAAAYVEWQGLVERHRELTGAEVDRASRLDLLTFQLQELRSLEPADGEYQELSAERNRLANSGRMAEGLTKALAALSDAEQGNAASRIADALRDVTALSEIDDGLFEVRELLETAAIQVGEAGDMLRRYGDLLDADPGRHEFVEERLDAFRSIARKHRTEPDGLIELLEKLEADHDELINAEARGKELDKKVAAARERYLEIASELSRQREQTAAALASQVTDTMHGLGMPGGEFRIEVRALSEEDAAAHGLDRIEFLITANPGQPLMPLSRVASGGELSRMSLSIQVIASDGSTIPTMVFDEVDSGVGGGVAEMVGRRLAQLGQHRQVLCVTHLPQVASLAASHFRVSKVTDGKVTRTSVQALDSEERIDELARMLGGVEITKKTREHAAEMLSGAGEKRA